MSNEIVLYEANDQSFKLEVTVQDDTIWLTQQQIVQLFDSSKANISEHIKNVFTTKELDEEATVRKIRTVRKEGNREVARNLTHYSLDVIKKAKKDIVLIDNYIDESTLLLLAKRNKNVNCTIYTQKTPKVMLQDLEKHNSQYPEIKVHTFKKAHDRFLILDQQTVYHIGASLKDLGKKWFAFSKIALDAKELLTKIGMNL